MISKQMWDTAIHRLELCYFLVDSKYYIFNIENYKELVELSRRVRMGERTDALYTAIYHWTL